MGTPEFAVASLDALVRAGYPVAGVVTAPDRAAGRGRKLRAPAVKEYALSKGLPVLQPEKLRDPDFLRELKALKADLQVVVAFRMLPEVVWAMPPLGTFNLHASLLPQYRGAAPINWALIHGDTETGVTTFLIDHQIDTGNILLQRATTIAPDEDAGALHDRLMQLGADLVVETVAGIESGSVSPKPQQVSDSLRHAPKLTRENCQILWDKPAQQVQNHIRGLSPFPGAWSLLHQGSDVLNAKVYRTRLTSLPAQDRPGNIRVEGNRLFVAAADHQLEVLEIQLEGKKRMPVSDLLNGFSLDKNAEFRSAPVS